MFFLQLSISLLILFSICLKAHFFFRLKRKALLCFKLHLGALKFLQIQGVLGSFSSLILEQFRK